jgi:hypothetical protein
MGKQMDSTITREAPQRSARRVKSRKRLVPDRSESKPLNHQKATVVSASMIRFLPSKDMNIALKGLHWNLIIARPPALPKANIAEASG